MMKGILKNRLILLIVLGFCRPVTGAPTAQPPAAPAIASLIKPEAMKKILSDRDIVTHASLDDVPGSKAQRYSYYAVMAVDASLPVTRKVLTDYGLYAKMVPYIDEATYTPLTHLLRLRGGIWRFKLASILKFEEKSEHWIHFDIVSGHFRGMSGDLFFEPGPVKGSVVYMRGELVGEHWPPAFIIERGAEIVFEFTAKRMRSYIESEERSQQLQAAPGATLKKGEVHDREVPKPRSHL